MRLVGGCAGSAGRLGGQPVTLWTELSLHSSRPCEQHNLVAVMHCTHGGENLVAVCECMRLRLREGVCVCADPR